MNNKVPYCIQKHNAFKAGLHYDLRIKYPNKRMLASFAIPKVKFPLGPGSKSIAIKVSDHGMSWLNKDTVNIPRGEYGAGIIKTVQKGQATIIRWATDMIIFDVSGEIADGRYYLVNTKRNKVTKKKAANSEVWIIFQRKDEESK